MSNKNIDLCKNRLKLVICEKPSQAQSFAAVLNAKKRQDGYFEGDGWLISWCYGHLVELAMADAYGEQYKRWSLDTLPILPKPDKWQYKASKSKAKQISVLRKLMNRSDVKSVVCAADAGREGELIFRLVYDYCKCKKPIQRLWISSLEDSAIREGFDKLRPGADFDNLYRAALCRAQADWAVGINATRLFSCLYGPTLNVGRVQTPTLAMIVEREKSIADFVSEPFYTPLIECKGMDADGVAYTFTAVGERHKGSVVGESDSNSDSNGDSNSGLESAEAVSAAADGADAVVLSVEKANKTTAQPRLYDLTSLQRDANRIFGFTAQQTLDYAQSLYEAKHITYPRTDSQYLTEDMKDSTLAVISSLLKSSSKTSAKLLNFANALSFAPDISKTINNSKVSDHHAIIPTLEATKADLSALPSGERDILSLIATRLLCAVAPIHKFETVTAILECGGHKFTAKGKTVLEDGWKSIDTAFRISIKSKPDKNNEDTNDENDEDTAALPGLVNGQVFPGVTATIREGKTKPPSRFTESTLLRAMETAGASDVSDDADIEHKGLGTPATRAGIIEKIINTGFVERQKKSLVPLPKGINLIAVLPSEIKSPALTADWEQKLKKIERGEISDDEFMAGIRTMVSGLVAVNNTPILEMISVFASMQHVGSNGSNSATKGNKSGVGGSKTAGKTIGNCLRCSSQVTESTKGFFCSSSSCKFVLWKDSRFWSAKGKTLTAKAAAALLKDGHVYFPDLMSEKTGKTYAATIILTDDGRRTDYKLEFSKGA